MRKYARDVSRDFCLSQEQRQRTVYRSDIIQHTNQELKV